MFNHLAIIIVGHQNSGKTTTLKHFHNTYNHREVDTFKQGWRYGISPFSPVYWGVKIVGYFLPSSRTERHLSLASIYDTLDWYPDFLFMAEQLDGAEYQNTINFLRANDYHIKEFVLSNENSDSTWHYYDKKDEDVILKHRTEQIADYVREFMRQRI